MGYTALCLIVNESYGSRVLKEAKKLGIVGGTVFYGEGTVRSSLLNMLGLEEVRREVVFLLTTSEKATEAIDHLDNKFQLDKPNHGIAFTVPLSHLSGVRGMEENNLEQIRKEREEMHQAICVVVDRGDSDRVMEAAEKAGARGGTIIHARGSGVEERKRFFQFDIDPEKDIVMILSESSQADHIVDSIHSELDLDKPNHGVLFKIDVSETRGLAKE